MKPEDSIHRTDIERMTQQLRRDAAEVRAAYRRLRTDENTAWARYVRDVDSTLAKMERDLNEERKALSVERARTQAELSEAVHELLARVHGTLDELQVQRALLQMETRDRINQLREPAEHALDRLRTKLDHAIGILAFVIG